MGNGSIDGYVRRITFIAALGGFLFGYDTGVISGALIYIAPDFDLGNFGQQAVVASLLLGAVVGSLVSGKLTDGLGRRRTLLITAGMFAAGALASAVSPSAAALIGSRFVIGLALGASSTAVPLYLAETSPKEKRGRLVSTNQFLIVVGILISYGVGYALASAEAWRWMLGLAAVPAVLMFVGLLFLPESPRWLFGKGREDEALEVMGGRGRRTEVDDEAERDQGDDRGRVRRELPRPPLSRRSARRCGSGSASPSSTSSAGSTRSSTTRRRSSSSRASATAPRSSGPSGWASSTCC